MADASIKPTIVTRQEAVSKNLDRYFTGIACSNGHVAERITKSRACVACQRLYTAAYRNRNPDKAESDRPAKREYNARYYEANKDSIALQAKKYREENKNLILESKRKYYEGNKAAVLQKAKARYQSKRQEIIAQAIAWAKENRDKRKAYENNRRAQKKQAGGSFTAKDILRILTAQKEKCAICRRSIKRAFHIDHIVALSKGGSNFPRNLQLLCPPCNMKKHKTDPIDYMQSLGFLI